MGFHGACLQARVRFEKSELGSVSKWAEIFIKNRAERSKARFLVKDSLDQ